MEQGRNSVRPADTLIPATGSGDEHRSPITTAAVRRKAAACARRPCGVEWICPPDPVRRRAGLDRLRNRRQRARQSGGAADHVRIRFSEQYGGVLPAATTASLLLLPPPYTRSPVRPSSHA